MHLFALLLSSVHGEFSASPSILCRAFHLKSFSFLQRGTVKEFCVFVARTSAAKSQPGTRCSVTQDQFVVHCYHMSDGLVATAITDAEYPPRAAFFTLKDAVSAFRQTHAETWKDQGTRRDREFKLSDLKPLLADRQDPRSFDPLIRAASATDEVIEVMNDNLQLALSRGEQLDELVGRSEDLSRRAKLFYKESKGKRCCDLM